jgi:type II secretory pathway pseudopilin PulG
LKRGRRAFTLIEALAAVVILTAGIAGALNGFAALARAQARLHERQVAEELAYQKLDELIATGEVAQSGVDGDFSEEGRPEWRWSMASQPSGIDSLNTIRLEVRGPGAQEPAVRIDALWFVPPQEAQEVQTP